MKVSKYSITVLTALIIGSVVYVSVFPVKPPSEQGSYTSHRFLDEEECFYHVEYHSSSYEKFWLQNIRDWQDTAISFCEHLQAERETLIEIVKGIDSGASIGDDHFDEDFFSRFEHTETCGTKTNTWTTYIEPLSGPLRDPRAVCPVKWDFLESKEWLQINQFRKEYSQYVYVDIGASGMAGSDGRWTSQDWIYSSYKQQGISFDRFILFEAKTYHPEDIFQNVPGDLFDAYQYFNIPATTGIDDSRNPLNLIRSIKARNPDSYIVLKLDIDNPIENEYIPQLEGLGVDEFFFEHHVQFPVMFNLWWQNACTFEKAECDKNVADSYDMLLKLRKDGMRAHSWP